MTLSFTNRRGGKSTSSSDQQQQQYNCLLLKKQNSFIETEKKNETYSNTSRHLKRGLSVDRSFDSIRQRLIFPSDRHKHYAAISERNLHIVEQNLARTTRIKFLNDSNQTNSSLRSNPVASNKRIIAWSSSSSLVKSTPNNETSKSDLGKENGTKVSRSNDKINIGNETVTQASEQENVSKSINPSIRDANKINLNIILSQEVIASSEYEAAIQSDDIERYSETNTNFTNYLNHNDLLKPTKEPKSAQRRRSLYQTSRYTLNNSLSVGFTKDSNDLNINNSHSNQSSSLPVPRRPALVRAMSAPVRNFSIDEKSINANNKRRLRRRKFISRNLSCEKTDEGDTTSKDIILEKDLNNCGKKVLSRARSTAAADIITFVSMISSEGSDSEKEDTVSANNSDKSPTKRAPLLRKTGKSVSFQENYPPNYQLASKDYSHMIRRGSIAPLAARLRANRPPTAPPSSSIFIHDKMNSEMMSIADEKNQNRTTILSEQDKQRNVEIGETNGLISTNNSQKDFIYPEYVRTIKERECWKLYQKMITKGVRVTYDTVSRGMLTPTEFRQLQKQREHVEIREAKEREANEEATGAAPKSVSAIDRLSEALLKK